MMNESNWQERAEQVREFIQNDTLLNAVSTNQLLQARLDQQEKLIMATQADLDTAIGNVETAIQQWGKDMLKAIGDLQEKITAGGTAADLQPEVDRMKAAATSIAGFDASAVAADPTALPPVPPTPVPPAAGSALGVGSKSPFRGGNA